MLAARCYLQAPVPAAFSGAPSGVDAASRPPLKPIEAERFDVKLPGSGTTHSRLLEGTAPRTGRSPREAHKGRMLPYLGQVTHSHGCQRLLLARSTTGFAQSSRLPAFQADQLDRPQLIQRTFQMPERTFHSSEGAVSWRHLLIRQSGGVGLEDQQPINSDLRISSPPIWSACRTEFRSSFHCICPV